MADQKKPKIDLKARLGKKSAAASSAAAPTSGAAGPGAAPPMAGPPGVGASSPFGSPSPVRQQAPAAPAAIRIEMDDEVVATRKRGVKRLLLAAVVACVAGVGFGIFMGSSMAARDSIEISLNGAQSLLKEVNASNAELAKLEALVDEVREALDPKNIEGSEAKLAAIASKLGEVHVPFTAASLAGKGIGRFKQATLGALFAYATGAEEANSLKERLQKRLSGSGVKAYLEQRKDPKFNLTVSVHGTPNGPWAVVRPVVEPFSVRKDGVSWPSDITVQAGQQTADFTRYTKGDPNRRVIPIDPQSEVALCPNPSATALQSALAGLGRLLKGSEGGSSGMIAQGAQLADSLKKIGAQ